ncbi:MAG: protein-export membrane protein SecF [Candidatus Staskawiczbacteria bacterium RIFOXYB2_FULL_32_9]|uniref:Protein-export membrane protein SecF n=1 Tax=Candidatus Staskawiczbacteria bacterium RIFOXYD1_FULL_32_13 TaxID=1802234 RepID=A0A1G2JKQ3_9BACT|nr:MAG: Protein translocase subunit SecF [Parcubacteria group bacterium GW2011_GWC2_32_10]OGZ77339.1 MAG: protein-export membrane protein SecF [Candidatus Staskawiczbacteria bacterium RIFOXYA2_FULL_32_7]OGZ77811.1 MAG: protein-export membrane protein SecF [Candidatus Staskawiczbacteria bacterium RIFOXYB1_FULL_32_11]OGZ82110.1 MAG: protein-export membrane protein SecF [Candidatus Staskawiczbacteria bacterium RIFOXYB2_FULL_32_9]OGZ87274.1 MAG: protein-export membrane protein SecF [Candidatus Stas
MNFNYTKYSPIYYTISGVLIIASIVCLSVFGLKFGIEFTGGSNMQIEFLENRPSNEDINKSLVDFKLGDIVIQPTGQKGVILQFKGVDEAIHQQILAKINELSKSEEKSFQFIGPSVGQELKNKTQIAIVMVLLAITIYIAFAFRKVSRPVASWKYGVTSLIALFHDILIPLGVFAVLGKFYNVEITIPIIAALLTVLGFSVHDTIVIFDRIRENILRKGMGQFKENVDLSLNQTLGRSLSTVFSTLIPLFAMYFFGGETLKYFSLALIIGITSGAYSSIFIAGPLLVSWRKWDEKKF